MEYFCPHCMDKFSHEDISFAIPMERENLIAAIEEYGISDNGARASVNYLFPESLPPRRYVKWSWFISPLASSCVEKVNDHTFMFSEDSDGLIEIFLTEFEKRKKSTSRDGKIAEQVAKQIEEFESVNDTNTKPESKHMETHKIKGFTERDENGDSIITKILIDDEKRFAPKRCYYCQKPIPMVAGTAEPFIIMLMGSQRVAKTSCIISAMHSLSISSGVVRVAIPSVWYKGDTKNLDCNDESWLKSGAPLHDEYKNGWAVTKTDTEYNPDSSIGRCISVKVDIAGNKPVVLSFFDVPGEYLNFNGSDIPLWYDYYVPLSMISDAIWFCIDEIQLKYIANPDSMNKCGYDVQTIAECENMIQKPTTLRDGLIEIEGVIKSSQMDQGTQAKGFPPAAIILTKAELLEGTNTPPNVFTRAKDKAPESQILTGKNAVLNLMQFEMYSKSVLKYLRQNQADGEVRIVDELVKIFSTSACFSTSAYSVESGKDLYKAPSGGVAGTTELQEPCIPMPFSTKLPIYWTLAIRGKLSVEVEEYEQGRRGQYHLVEPKPMKYAKDTYCDRSGKLQTVGLHLSISAQ